MAIAHVTTGTALSGNAGTTTVSMAYPASLAAGNIVLAGRTVKPETATAADETGWTMAANATGGTATTGLDVGLTRGKVDYKILDGSESGSVTFDQGSTPNSVAGCMIQYSKSAGTWDVAATTGDDAAHGNGRSATGSAISLQSGDVIVAFVHSDTDATTAYTSPAISATGMTITTTQRLGASGASQNNDSGIAIFEGAITAGSTATVAPAISLSAGPTNCGSTSFVRIRQLPGATAAPAVIARTVVMPAPTLIAGPQSVRFDAAGETYTTANVTGLSGGDYTFAAWVYLASDRNIESTMLGADNGTAVSYIVTAVDGTSISWETAAGTISNGSLTVGAWHYVAVVQSVAGTDTLFQASAASSTLTAVTGTATAGLASNMIIRMADNTFGTTYRFDGRIAQVKIWSAALTQVELEAEKPVDGVVRTADLWAYYSFRDGPQTLDESLNGRTLTPGGTLTSEQGPSVAPVSGGGTATPAVIARSVTMPAPTVPQDATAAPALIARTAAVPASTTTAGVGATTAPAVIARVAVVPASTTGAGATATPAVIARSVTTPTVTPQASTTTTPTVIARTAALAAPTPQAGTVMSPAVITRTVTIPQATGSGGAPPIAAYIGDTQVVALYIGSTPVTTSLG